MRRFSSTFLTILMLNAISRFDLPFAGEVKLEVFDFSGRNVGAHRIFASEPGTHTISFDGSNLASGIYFYRLTAGDFTGSGKMVLIQ